MIEGAIGDARWWFTDRHGGVSQGPFASLNLGLHVDDDPSAVEENRARLAARLGLPDPAQWRWTRQVHGTAVLDADAPFASVPDADGTVTSVAGVPLTVFGADCGMVVLVAGEGEALAVVHAGWTGLLAGAVGEGCAALRARSDAPIRAVLGPCIHGASYAFGAEDLQRLVDRFGAGVATRTTDGQPAFDLPAGLRQACLEGGAVAFDDVGVDTFTSADHFSFRRDGVTGRQIAVAVIG
jgi:YfiH family protein